MLSTRAISEPPSWGVTRPWISTGPPPAASAFQMTVERIWTSSAVLAAVAVHDGAPAAVTNAAVEVIVKFVPSTVAG